jgi:hypothetical protein
MAMVDFNPCRCESGDPMGVLVYRADAPAQLRGDLHVVCCKWCGFGVPFIALCYRSDSMMPLAIEAWNAAMTPDKAAGAVPLSGRLRPHVECAPWVIEAVQEIEAAIAERDARITLLESDAERISSCPWRVQKGCTALCQPPKNMRAAEAQLATLTARLGELSAKWRDNTYLIAPGMYYADELDALRLAALTGDSHAD